MRRAAATLLLALALAGAAEARRPVGTVVLVPGSGWRGADALDVVKLSIDVAAWQRWGFRTRAAPYGPGKTGIADVHAAVRAAKRRHPRLPVCLYGESSGGTWALIVAARRRDVACVVVAGAPTDEDTWRRGATGPARTFAYRIWPAFFGLGRADDAFEPLDVWRATGSRIPVFYVAAANDRVVPPAQGRVFARRTPRTTLRTLRAGRRLFVHSLVDRRQFERVAVAVRRFVRAAVR
jgi:predicted alpha/beta hydrolase